MSAIAPQRETPRDERLPGFVGPLTLSLLCLLLALPFFFGDVLLFRDLLHFNIPEQVQVARALGALRLPEWNPFVYGGVPLLAEMGSGVFYPPNWLFLVLDPWRAATVFVLVHLPVAALGTVLLARRLGLSRDASAIAAAGFTASGYLLSMHGGHYYFASAALLPLSIATLLAALDQRTSRAIGWAALTVALLIFNGEVQSLLCAALVAGALALAPMEQAASGAAPITSAVDPRPRRARQTALRLIVLAGTLVLGAALGAVQLIPAARYTSSTTRAHGVELAQASLWALHPLRLLDLLIPQPWGMPYPDNGFWGRALLNGPHQVPWAPSLWLATPLVLLALMTPWRRSSGRRTALVAVALLSLLCAMGARTPIFALVRTLVPLADRFRYPEKFALPATLAIVLLGAIGIDELSSARARLRSLAVLVGSALLFGAGAGVALLQPTALMLAIASGLRAGEANLSALEAVHALAGALGEASLLCGACALACAAGQRRPRLVPAIFLIAIAGAQAANGLALLSYGAASDLRREPALVETLRAAIPLGSAGRVAAEGDCQYRGGGDGPLLSRVRAFQLESGHDNLLSLYGLRAAIGYGAVESQSQIDLFHALSRIGREEALRTFGAAARFGCDAQGLVRVSPIAMPLPRVRLARAIAAEESLDAQARALVDEARVNFATALVDRSELAQIPVPIAPGQATLLRETPEQIGLQADGGGGLLVLAERFSEGWSVRVDGKPARILVADAQWRAVSLSPGPHAVEFSYRTPGLQQGAIISLVALALLLFLLVRPRAARPPE